MNKGRLIRLTLTQDTLLDFDKISNGQGVFHLTIENVGETTFFIDDATQQHFSPGEIFVVESPVPIINSLLPLIFKWEHGKYSKVIVNYVIGINC